MGRTVHHKLSSPFQNLPSHHLPKHLTDVSLLFSLMFAFYLSPILSCARTPEGPRANRDVIKVYLLTSPWKLCRKHVGRCRKSSVAIKRTPYHHTYSIYGLSPKLLQSYKVGSTQSSGMSLYAVAFKISLCWN